MFAAYLGHIDVVKELEGAILNLENDDGKTALDMAIQQEQTEIIRKLEETLPMVKSAARRTTA